MNEMNITQNRLAVSESLIQQHMSLQHSAQLGVDLFNPESDFTIAATYFILNWEEEANVELFTTHTLERLLRQLSHSTEQHQVEYRGQVRGHVLWYSTYKDRYCEDYAPDRFVCQEVHLRYNTPENQLLKYLLERISVCVKSVPQIIRQGVCYVPDTEQSFPAITAIRLGRIETAINNFCRNVRLQEIQTPQRITEQHLRHAETAQLEEYGHVAKVYRCYRDIVETPSWDSLVNIGKRVLPLPGRTGERADRWIRLGALILRSSSQ